MILPPCSCGGSSQFDYDDEMFCIRCEDCTNETPYLFFEGDRSDANIKRLVREALVLWNEINDTNAE